MHILSLTAPFHSLLLYVFLQVFLKFRVSCSFTLADIGKETGWGAKQVATIVQGSPADLDGRIQPGDTLLAIDGVTVDAGMAQDRIRELRRPVGSRCLLTMSRMGHSFEVELQWTSLVMTNMGQNLLETLADTRSAIETEYDRNVMLARLEKVGASGMGYRRCCWP